MERSFGCRPRELPQRYVDGSEVSFAMKVQTLSEEDYLWKGGLPGREVLLRLRSALLGIMNWERRCLRGSEASSERAYSSEFWSVIFHAMIEIILTIIRIGASRPVE